MAVLIDASILIEYERGRLDLERYLTHRQQEEFFLSVVTASELLHGVDRAGQPEVPTKRSAFVEAILERFPLRQALRDLGYVEGQNLAIEYRYAANQVEHLPDLAAEVVRLPVDVVVVGGMNAARVVQHATRTIPIVLVAGGDPVGLGLLPVSRSQGGTSQGCPSRARC